MTRVALFGLRWAVRVRAVRAFGAPRACLCVQDPPATPSVTWQSAVRRTHGFASPPYDGFAIVEDDELSVLFGDRLRIAASTP